MFTGPSYEQQRLLPAQVEDRLIAWAGRVTGFVLLALLALMWLSVLSWSLTDPSLTHATGGRAQNWLGGLGAILSDLFLQTLGFATAVALFAPMFWGLELAIGERVLYFRSKAAYYPLSVLAIAGALSSLPVASSWPLHHGYGGILGDLVYSLGTTMFGLLNPERAGLASGLLFALAGTSALVQSLGVPLKEIGWALTPFTLGGLKSARGSWHLNLKAEAERLAERVPGFGRAAPDSAQPAARYEDEAPYDEPAYDDPPTDGYAGGDAAEQEPREDWTLRRDDLDFPPFETAGRRMPPAPMPQFRGGAMPPPPGPSEPFSPEAFARETRPGSVASRFAQVLTESRGDGDREPRFDDSTEEMSRFIAERFAPPGSQTLPMPPRPREPQRAPKKSLLGSLSLGRKKGEYRRPALALLKRPAAPRPSPELAQTVLRGNAGLLQDVLMDFGVKGEVRDIKPGPVVTLFEVEPARGTKSARVIALADDIARSMSAQSVRVAVVPGRNAIGIELPNMRREPVMLREILESTAYRVSDAALPLALGKSIGGEPVVADLARMPHLLVAGTTGSGKSVGVNAMILSLIYRHAPEDCRFLMIDPKMLELSVYNGIPHLLTPVVTDPKKAVAALNWVVAEMEERYKRMSKLSVRNIDAYNSRIRAAEKRGEALSRTVQTGFDRATGQAVYERQSMDLETMPYIVVVIDEFADLMIVAGKEIEALVQRLAQMARAAGIHLIMATQRPSVDVITGTIKANFPTRISFKVTSKIDSRTILNDQGAEQLLGQGDMLYAAGGGQTMRVHGPFVGDEEVESIAQALREQGEPNYVEGILDTPAAGEAELDDEDRETGEDDLFDRAVAVVLRDRKASTSYIQRRLSIGYNRAADLIERMEQEGIVGPANHAGKRDILGASSGYGAD